MKKFPNVGATLAHVVIEMIFAVLPLLVLGFMWPGLDEEHPETFWQGPELSMTSCVLFGLTLARLLQGSLVAARTTSGDVREKATGFALISMIPLVGVVISVLLIAKMSTATHNNLLLISQLLVFCLALLTFVILGGYGLNRFDSE